ncbi:hypothetical protein ABRZ08_13070 [Castellaniella ginsengisoli]|uniref:Replicative helicase inhibitor G39P N-terminal domain-containing protein n=1 Tax=Castellaniella ginsengisoli TaxID=546114 RepID=A0AB39G3R0_9BURK
MTTAPTPLPLTWATKLIERLHLLYGTRFSQAWEGIDKAQLAQAWAEELAGFTGDELAVGLAACKSRPWPPTLPEFIVLCRPWLDPETAFRIAVAGMQDRRSGKPGNWPHPALFWAAVEVGGYDMVLHSYQTLKSRWETAFSVHMGQGAWEDIPAPTPVLSGPSSQPASREQIDASVQEMAATAANSKPRDPKAWARKILANPKGRTQAIVEMAKRALEQHQEVVA